MFKDRLEDLEKMQPSGTYEFFFRAKQVKINRSLFYLFQSAQAR